MDDQADRAPWTIKAVPVGTRKLAGACAAKTGETMGEWLARAVRNQANLEAGERVIPAGRPGLPAVQPAGQTAMPIDFAELAQVLHALEVTGRAAGVPVPKDIARHAYAAVRTRLRAARGLPPVKPRQTRPQFGQTITADHEP